MLTVSSPPLSPPPATLGTQDSCTPSQSREEGARSARLLYLATSKNDGGVERYSVRMAAELRRRGHPVLFACLAHEIIDRRSREAGLPTHPFSLHNSGDFRAARRLADLILEERIDLVHVHSRRDYVPAVLGILLARHRLRSRSPRLVLHAHMLRVLGEPPGLSGRLFAWAADAVIAVSAAVQEHLLREHGFLPSFVRLLHNGVDLEAFPMPESPAALASRRNQRCTWGLSPNALVLGMVGRLDAKGQASLLQVAPTLVARFPTLRFVFVGAEGSPGERERLRARAVHGGFDDRLVFTGPSEDVPALLSALDVLAHLPTDESFGLALLEAMAAGLPTVATDIGGCREVVQDGVTGALVPPNDVTALTNTLSDLLAQPELRRRWGESGRLVAERDFNFARQMDQIEALYAELCPHPQPSIT